MTRVRVFQVVTRMVHGGAQRIVVHLLNRLPRGEFRQTLVCGVEGGENGALMDEVTAAGVETVRMSGLVREIRPAADVAATARLAWIFALRRPHVVHAHTYKAGVLASLAARVAGVPAVVFTPHGHIFARGARIPGVPRPGRTLGLLRRITCIAQSCAHRVTALSEPDLREQLRLDLSPPSKYEIIRNGIDTEHFASFPAPVREAGGPVIGAVGRFTSEKGHGLLIEAFVEVRKRLPGARLVLVGYGELEPELRRQVRDRGLDGAVRFAGERDSAEMLPGFDVFVQPSLYESQGMAILEAMAAGRPVVATDVGGVRDVVQDGETGLLVRGGDPAALARGIVRLVEEPGVAAGLAARARERVREHFSVDRMVADYARLYNRLLGRYNPPECTIS